MKRIFAWILLLCLLLSGCRGGEAPGTETQAQPQTSEPTQQTAASTTEPSEGETENSGSGSIIATEGTLPVGGLDEKPQGDALTIGETGKIRLTYSVNLSSVRYVTSVSQLPECEGLEAFDEAYFREHALLIVIETVSSGTVDTGIESVTVNEDGAVVTLFHEAKSDVVTADMTTWLLWAEVEKDLDYSWTVFNPATESSASQY